MIEDQPFRVRTWYGLPAEIVVGRTWHWVRAAGLPLSHTGHAEHEAVLREVLKTSAVCCPLRVWISLRPGRCRLELAPRLPVSRGRVLRASCW